MRVVKIERPQTWCFGLIAAKTSQSNCSNSWGDFSLQTHRSKAIGSQESLHLPGEQLGFSATPHLNASNDKLYEKGGVLSLSTM
jgi:hypothetical protein